MLTLTEQVEFTVSAAVRQRKSASRTEGQNGNHFQGPVCSYCGLSQKKMLPERRKKLRNVVLGSSIGKVNGYRNFKRLGDFLVIFGNCSLSVFRT